MEPKHYRLKWNNFHKNLLNEFESMQNTEELADVTLTCEGINLKAHKFILSACSPYFRTVFKENPCHHPIVILKDIYYVDLIAIINYMYHGEVMVSEDNLTTFLETAVILQVSGLANSRKPTPTKHKNRREKGHAPSPDLSHKRLKKSPTTDSNFTPKVIKDLHQFSPSRDQCLDVENVKLEKTENIPVDDVLEDSKDSDVIEKSDPPSSILEAALELRDKPSSSILERSLTCNTSEKLNTFSMVSDVPKAIFIPRKPPESEFESQMIRSSSESSNTSTFDRPSEIMQQTIKIENDDLYEMTEVTSPEDIRNYHQTAKHVEIQPHHSSQCGNCPHCGQIYTNQSALKYHVRLVHSDMTNMFCCHLCPESFDYREGYKKHMAEVHLMRN